MLESVHCLIGCFESVHPFAENDALTWEIVNPSYTGRL
jgi:hypothetical protein